MLILTIKKKLFQINFIIYLNPNLFMNYINIVSIKKKSLLKINKYLLYMRLSSKIKLLKILYSLKHLKKL